MARRLVLGRAVGAGDTEGLAWTWGRSTYHSWQRQGAAGGGGGPDLDDLQEAGASVHPLTTRMVTTQAGAKQGVGPDCLWDPASHDTACSSFLDQRGPLNGPQMQPSTPVCLSKSHLHRGAALMAVSRAVPAQLFGLPTCPRGCVTALSAECHRDKGWALCVSCICLLSVVSCTQHTACEVLPEGMSE